MIQFLISLDEVERVKKLNGIKSTVELAEKSNVSRATWSRILKSREPKDTVIQALAALGARPNKILISENTAEIAA